jgi:hypothetical protein
MGDQSHCNDRAQGSVAPILDSLKTVGCHELLQAVSSGCVENTNGANQGSSYIFWSSNSLKWQQCS